MNWSWIFKMAWRDGRQARRHLMLFLSPIVLGIAALVALQSFDAMVQNAINTESKALLGADLVFQSRTAFDDDGLAFIDSVETLSAGGASHEIRFGSMAFFPETENRGEETGLVQVRAIDGGFPFYGELETIPATAANDYKEGGALVDASLFTKFDLTVGDSVKIGRNMYEIAGRLKKVPGEAAMASIVGPKIYVPLSDIDSTLFTVGSLANWRVAYQFEDEADVEALVTSIQPRLKELTWSSDTVEERKQGLGGAMKNLNQFLRLAGFIALLLGGLGVASGIHVYIRRKIKAVGLLRSLGVSSQEAALIFLTQVTVMGTAGAIIGAALGTALPAMLPVLLADFLPVKVAFTISWSAILTGTLTGILTAVIFALQPLLSVWSVSPLIVLRNLQTSSSDGVSKVVRFGLYFFVLLSLIGLAWLQTGSLMVAGGFTAGLLVVFAILAIVTQLFVYLVKRFYPRKVSFTIRQGLSNLFRPNNQTFMLVFALGLSTFLVMTLFLSRQMLLDQIEFTSGPDQPNMILFDIQPDQHAGVQNLLKKSDFPVLQDVPIVTMRLKSINGISTIILADDTTKDISGQMLRREFRSTWRDSLTNTEVITAGEFTGEMTDFDQPIPISIEDGMGGSLQIGLGDTLLWNVQGVEMLSVVGSIRKVDWQRVQPNFFVVFPAGVLEYAPHTLAVVTRTENAQEAGSLQRDLVKAFPNISAIDLTLILETVQNILSRVSFALQGMSMFTIITGLMVLIAALMASRLQRVRENTLLRTLGAGRRQLYLVLVVEYAVLGIIAAFIGVLLAAVAAVALSQLMFSVEWTPAGGPILLSVLVVTSLTVSIGLFNYRSILKQSPLEVLRQEV